MVPISNMIIMGIICFLCFAIPITLIIIVRIKSKRVMGAFFAGILSFYVMQAIFRINILQYVMPNVRWFVELPQNSIFLYALLLGFTAALFETVGRYFTIKYVLKDRLAYYSGISHGIGHGGIEMMYLIGLGYINNIVYSIQINAGTFQNTIDQVAASQPEVASQLEAVIPILISTPASMYWIALAERILALTVQIALSLLIMEGIVRRKDMKFTAIVLFLHTLLDTSAIMLSANGVNHWLIEAYLALYAVGAVVYILTSRKRFGDNIYPKDKDSEALASNY